ncbi:MAG: GDP-L-fucose synthase [Gammaproteobacteria bacterium]|nr:GDP-L-fucose synthase [Gammaproteobacteria bacterium]
MSSPAPYSLAGKRLWVAGHRGMVGQALLRRLRHGKEFETCEILTAARDELDLRNQQAVATWVRRKKPQAVIISVARVGNIYSNNMFPAEILYDNLMITVNIIHAAYLSGVEKLLFIGSSCIYPRLAEQPIKEDALLSGKLDPDHESYAVAKIAGIKLCQAYRRQYRCDYISAIPANLYGPEDDFNIRSSHVSAALLKKFHDATVHNHDTVTVWGTGKPRREFLHVDDAADAFLFLLRHYSDANIINVGSGEEVTVSAFARYIIDITGFKGRVVYDPSYPDGVPRRVLDVSALHKMGWRAKIPLDKGLRLYYDWFLDSRHRLRHADYPPESSPQPV